MNAVIESDKHAKQKRLSRAAAAPTDLVAQALAGGAGMDVVQMLIALQERERARAAHLAFIAAFTEFKKSAPTILKDKNVLLDNGSYNHATLGGVCDAVVESLAMHGITHSWDTAQPENGMIAITCTLTHLMGHSQGTTLEGPPDNTGYKNGVQQISSTVTLLQRYTLLGVCGLAPKDVLDNDGRGAGVAPAGAPNETCEPTAALLAVAKAAANCGAETYAKFWADTGRENRALLFPHHEHHKMMAERVSRPATCAAG